MSASASPEGNKVSTESGNRDRKITDSERFAAAMAGLAGRRLTYSELTGKDESPRTQATETGTMEVPF